MRPEEWQDLAARHEQRVAPWISGRLERRPLGRKNAIEDFLFDYYPYSPGKLSTWHPGFGIVLEGDEALPYLDRTGYHRVPGGVTADPAWLVPRRQRLDLAIAILEGTMGRPASIGCFGLHEWAMVYGQGQDEVRHAYLPLRVSPEQVTDTVDAVGLRCTHIDAYRFFTPEAVPVNDHEPSRATQPDLEQPGCLHAAMDLYKYAFWFSPLVPSDLVLDCFENAARARTIDMQASPYDMEPFGLEPIPVETTAGRRAYAIAQRSLMEATDPLRARLLDTLVGLQSASDRAEPKSDSTADLTSAR